jgi:Trp operon repressor
MNTVKKVLEDAGHTQRELSERSKVSLTTINRVCNHEVEVANRTKSKIVKGMNELTGAGHSAESLFGTAVA